MEFIMECILEAFGGAAEVFLNKHLKTKTAKLLFGSLIVIGVITFMVTLYWNVHY